MNRFADLFQQLDSTTRTAEKVKALAAYFREAPAEDAAWALFFLTGNRIKRAVPTARLRDWAAESAGLPAWLVEESYDEVGDFAEALALLVPPAAEIEQRTLAQVVEEFILPLPRLSDVDQKRVVLSAWRSLPALHSFLWLKMLTGEFRIGVAKTLVIRALAQAAGVEPAVMSHRLMGNWRPDADFYKSLLRSETGDDALRPYPFFLANPLEGDPLHLGAVEDWQAEWKWDGIRAQLLCRRGQFAVWSRGEELLTDRFPELHPLASAIPEGTVLDGEILAWSKDRPLPFAALQKRIGRTKLTARILKESPVVYMAFDVLELAGNDVRARPLAERRDMLERLGRAALSCWRLSPLLAARSWEDLAEERLAARAQGAEGLMLKRRASPYGVGRTVGDWWKWKAQPYAIDAVLVAAQRGHGRRASLFTDYTFALWEGSELVPMAKAYSGLTDAELREVDAFVRRSTLEEFGPVHVVPAELVFELHFEGIQRSTRHKSGVAVRFPRIARWRRDKRPADADSLESLRKLLPPAPQPAELQMQLPFGE